LDNPLHVILNNSKLAYRIYVILIANKELIKKICTLTAFVSSVGDQIKLSLSLKLASETKIELSKQSENLGISRNRLTAQTCVQGTRQLSTGYLSGTESF
jgi:hypothetical protein